METIEIHREALNSNPFSLSPLKVYPSELEGFEVPVFTLRDPSLSLVERICEVHGPVRLKTAKPTLFPSIEHILVVMDHFCEELSCRPLGLSEHFQIATLKLKDYMISENQD